VVIVIFVTHQKGELIILNINRYFEGVENGKQCMGCGDIFPSTENDKTLETHIEHCKGWDNYFNDKQNKPTNEIPWMKYDEYTDIWACECGQYFDNIEPEFDAKTEAYKHQKRHAYLRMTTIFKTNLNDSEDFK